MSGQMSIYDFPEYLPEEKKAEIPQKPVICVIEDLEQLIAEILHLKVKVGSMGRIRGLMACTVSETAKVDFIRKELPIEIGCSDELLLEAFEKIFKGGYRHADRTERNELRKEIQ